MNVRKYHSILLLTSVLFMLAHNMMPHQHDGGPRSRQYTVLEKRGDIVSLVRRALTSDLGESHLEHAAFQEINFYPGTVFMQDLKCQQVLTGSSFCNEKSQYPVARDDRSTPYCLACNCLALRAPPVA